MTRSYYYAAWPGGSAWMSLDDIVNKCRADRCQAAIFCEEGFCVGTVYPNGEVYFGGV